MRRGFKSEAERAALAARVAVKVAPGSPLDPWAYPKHLGIVILDFESLSLSSATRKQLLEVDYESWSAMTIKENGIDVIIVNPRHARTRQCTNLMHEIAHIELGHVPARVEVSKITGLLLLSDYSDEQELEADWRAAAMLLPRDALVGHRKRRKSVSDIAEHFCLSEQLVEWRIRMTGVDVQIRRAGNYP